MLFKIACGATLGAAFLLLAQPAPAQTTFAYPPLVSDSDFTLVAPQGFGDRQNTWAWSMAWFQGKLFVGTNRAYECVKAQAKSQAYPFYSYPPKDPDVSCTADANDLPLQAEIWSYDPTSGIWNRVFQSPNTVPIPGTNPVKYTAQDIGFRGMLVYTESDGSQALYVGGCSSIEIHAGIPGGRMLRTTDGVNFTAIPQDTGTALGSMANACFRGMIQQGNTMFAMATDWNGQGNVIMSSNPSAGDNAFQQITDSTTPAYEIEWFNNLLYVTFVDQINGFSVGYTNPFAGAPPFTYTVVIPNGGYGPTDLSNPIALSMSVYNGDLYVGGDGVHHGNPITSGPAELFRIYADNTWDIVAGNSRNTPIGQKNSLSGLPPGFGWALNEHMWRQVIYDNRLYIGTFDEATELRNTPLGTLLAADQEYGFDLWWTEDGTYFTEASQDGLGDQFNYGGRSLLAAPSACLGLFVGSANPYYGTKIYQGLPAGAACTTTASGNLVSKVAPGPARVQPPKHVQVERGQPGALLSWDPPAAGSPKTYHIFRLTFQANVGDSPDAAPGSRAMSKTVRKEIGATDKLVYQDRSVAPGGRYAYEIMSEDQPGTLSGPSNFVIFPSVSPAATFADAEEALGRVGRPSRLATLLTQAEEDSAKGDFQTLDTLLETLRDGTTLDNSHASRDLELAVSRLQKRARLVRSGLLKGKALAQTMAQISSGPCVPAQTPCPTPPPQPTSGPGGNGYTNSAVVTNGPYFANNRYSQADFEYYIYEPAQPTPVSAPVILFLHGYSALTPDSYLEWIKNLVKQGYIVVWPQYQANVASRFSNYPTNAQAAWTDALYRLQNYYWENHVKPATNPDGSVKNIIVGHSFGGWIAAWLAGAQSTAVPSFPPPEALVMIEPASLGLLPTPTFANISPGMKYVIVSSDEDTVACTADGVRIFESTPQVPAAQKNYLFFNTDNHGVPNQIGNHYYPATNGYMNDATVDARDYFVTWKLSEAAASCVFTGTYCSTFLGAGNTEQTTMSNWSDGVPVTPMSYYADPTQLPPVTGCGVGSPNPWQKPTTTSLGLSAGSNPSVGGQSLTFQATVSPSTATGNVTFFDGANPLGSGTLSGGIAAFNTAALAIGQHSIGATYNGDARDAPSMAGTLAQAVNQAPAAPSIMTNRLPAGEAGTTYSVVLLAIGGSGQYAWGSGGLPPGLVLSSSGTLSGTPSAPFSGLVSLMVTDPLTGYSASSEMALAIAAPISLSGKANLGDVPVNASIAASYGASNGMPPFQWSLSGSPGLVVDSNGNVSGSASQPGSFNATLTVTDALNASSSLTLSLAVLGITGSFPTGSTTSPYNGGVSGAGGVPPYSWTASGVPPGLTFSGGTLSGQETIAATWTMEVQITDSNGVNVREYLPITVIGTPPAVLTIADTALPDGLVGQPYSETLGAAGGVPGYSWSRSGGQIPAGLSLAGSGIVSGLPTAPGLWTMGLDVSDAAGSQAVGTVTINVQPAPLLVTSGSAFPVGTPGVHYPAQVLTATGGVPPYTFSVASVASVANGSLPGGLAVTDGQIAGIPTAAGTFDFTLVATDSAPVPATASWAASVTIESNPWQLILSAGSASFSMAPSATALPPPATITVASGAVSQILTFTASTSTPWITVGGSSSTPGSITVGLNSAALTLDAAGSPYTGVVTVTCTFLNCSGETQAIAVSLTVSNPPARLSLSSPLLSFTAAAANPQPAQASLDTSLNIVNAGGGSLAIQSVAAADSWLSIGAFPAAVAPGPGAPLAIGVNPSGLTAGFHLSSVTVVSSSGSQSVPVRLLVTNSGSMTLAPAGIQVSVPLGGAPGNSTGSFLVGVSSGSIGFNASLLPGASWLAGGGTGVASPASPGVVPYSIDPSAVAQLPQGTYYGTIRVAASGTGVVNPSQDFQVVLNVGPASAEIIPDPEPAGLVFIGSNGSSAALPAQTIQLHASSANAIGYQASPTIIDGGGWLSVAPETGTTSASSPAQISVSVNPAGLSPGVYRAGIGFAFAESVRTVNVTLIVPAPACSGTQPVEVQTALPGNFSVPVSRPVPLAVRLVDGCGNPVGSAQIVANFSNGDPPVVLSPIDRGRGLYSGTWTPLTASPQVTVSTVTSAPGYGAATTEIPGQVTPATSPVLAPNGALDAFDPQIGAALAPGSLVQIYGSNLASKIASASLVPLPTNIGGTSVTVGGLNAPLFYVSPGQINAQIPFELAAGGQYEIVVSAAGALTTPQRVDLAQTAPAILQFTSGAVMAQHQNGTLVQDSAPAVPGEFLTIYLSGMGDTTTPVPSGAPSPVSPLARVMENPPLTLNGASLPALFMGLTPGLVGLYQVDFQVPAPLQDGDYTLLISAGGTVANKTILPVKN